MGQYFFKMSQSEKNDILDKHKTIYDGYVTQYGQQSNTQPLYVQDYANDKEGMVVSNKGVVKPYTNMGINESHTGSDMIGDGVYDLKNGTVDFENNSDFPSPNENEFDYISLGNTGDECKHCDDDNLDIVIDVDDYELGEGFDDYNIMKMRDGIDYSENEFPKKNKYRVNMSDVNFGDKIPPKLKDDLDSEFDFDFEEVDEEILPEFMEKLTESLDMFSRFKKYN